MIKDAELLAKEQREISVSEFFEKNRHLLGFDNPAKALLMAVKEFVDNSLDACEEAGILPDIYVSIKKVGEDVFRVTVKDNGPGILKEQVPKVFGKLLYGSKFRGLGSTGKQSRGQQGIGASACILYAQLTTGKPAKIESWVKGREHYKCSLLIDTITNEPIIEKEEVLENGLDKHGVSVTLELKGMYRTVKGPEEYLKETAIANPHAQITFVRPDGTRITFKRGTDKLPVLPKEIKPHPYGIELGTLIKMLKATSSRTLLSFLTTSFSRLGTNVAKEISKISKVPLSLHPYEVTRDQAEKLLKAMQSVKLQRPPTDCLSPIGEEEIIKGLQKEYKCDFVTAISRPATIYRAIPFQVEVGLAYTQDLKQDSQIKLIRYANKVPLFYQQGECAIYKAIVDTDWRRYGLQHTKGNLPIGPVVLVVHLASVWVPFISEGKQAIASYPEIIKEIKLAANEVGRRLKKYLSGIERKRYKEMRIKVFERYSGEVARALSILTEEDEKKTFDIIMRSINMRRGDEHGK